MNIGSSTQHYTLPERQSYQSDRILKQGIFKSFNFPTVQRTGKNLEVQSNLLFPEPNFQSRP